MTVGLVGALFEITRHDTARSKAGRDESTVDHRETISEPQADDHLSVFVSAVIELGGVFASTADTLEDRYREWWLGSVQ